MSSRTDERGLCVTCGGNGCLVRDEVPTEAQIAQMRPLRAARARATGVVTVCVDCPTCDGSDVVSSLGEDRAP